MSGINGISITVIFQIICTLVIAVFGFFIKREMKRLDDTDETNRQEQKETKQDLEKLKDDYNKYKAELPFNFVTKDEFIRAMSNFDHKLDKIYDCIIQKEVAVSSMEGLDRPIADTKVRSKLGGRNYE